MKKTNHAYELWALGYNADEMSTDFETLVAEFPYTPEGKKKGLDQLEKITVKDLGGVPADVKSVHLALELVADFSKTERSAIDVCKTRQIDVD